MILVDFSQTMYANIFAVSKGSPIIDTDLLYHMVCNSLRKIKEKHGRKYGRMVLCYDSGNPWRRDYYPHYKAQRKAKRAEKDQESVRDMFDFMRDIQTDLALYSPYPIVHVDRCEADDIIAVLTQNATEPVLIVSNDQDYHQLHNKDVQQYLSLKDKVVQCDDPAADLREKIARGDKSDSIPNVVSDDDVFVTEGKRQKPLRAKVLNEVMSGIYPSPEISRNFDRNRQLIDLSQIPEKYTEQILENYTSAADAKYAQKNRGMDFYKYLMTKKMKILAEKAEIFMIGE